MSYVNLAKDCFVIDFEYFTVGKNIFPYEIGVSRVVNGQIVSTFHSFFDNTD